MTVALVLHRADGAPRIRSDVLAGTDDRQGST
jgi:hypothetical protein